MTFGMAAASPRAADGRVPIAEGISGVASGCFSPAACSAAVLIMSARAELDLALALFAAEEAQGDVGIGREPGRPSGVHGAARIEAVMQVPEVPDVVGGALGEAHLERRHAFFAEAVRGRDRL